MKVNKHVKTCCLGSYNLTDEQLAKKVSGGIIPQDVTYLMLWDNQISDLTPLSGLANLSCLILNGNQISNLAPLSGLTNLEILELNGNNINDITPLIKLTNLTSLELDDNPISEESISELQKALSMKRHPKRKILFKPKEYVYE